MTNERVEAIRRKKDCTVCLWANGQHSELCKVGILLAALAQAERERDEMRTYKSEMYRERKRAEEMLAERDAARAEVERLTVLLDSEQVELARQQYKARKAEATLARVRAALDGTHYHHKAYEPECSHCRAALEGQ